MKFLENDVLTTNLGFTIPSLTMMNINAEKGEIGLFKKDDELVVEIGTLRRHIGLPTSMSSLAPASARMDGTMLVIEMRSNV